VAAGCVGLATSVLNTDECSGYARVESNIRITHRTVRHSYEQDGRREWACDDDGDGVREVHCNGCEGAGAPLRTFLRALRGVHKEHLAEYVARGPACSSIQPSSAFPGSATRNCR
jgi:transposase